MKILKFFLFLVFLSIVIIIKAQVTNAQTIASSDLIINEFMPNPAGSDTDFEWVELKNISENSINLSEWKLNNVTLPSANIEKNGFIIIARNATQVKSRYGSNLNVVQSSFSLNNSNGSITLSHTTNSQTDSLTYTSSVEEVSIERVNSCTTNLELHPETNSIGSENANFDEEECLPLQLKIYLNENETKAAFLNQTIKLQLEGNLDNISTISWIINENVIETTETTYTFKIDHYGVNHFEVILTDNLGNQIHLTKELMVYPQIKLNEIFANAEGEDTGNEWIEFFNPEKISLEGWLLSDASNTVQQLHLTDGEQFPTLIPAFSLNNTEETLTLSTPEGLISDQVNYSDAVENKSYSRSFDGEGEWTWDFESTKSASNLIGNQETPEIPPSENILKINDAKLKDLDSEVVVKGIITSRSGLFGANISYMQDETSGIRIKLPEDVSLEEGQYIKIKGVLKISRGEFYIGVNTFEELVENIPIIRPTPMGTTNLEKIEGSLVSVEGAVDSKSGLTFYILQNEIKWKVNLQDEIELDFEIIKGETFKIIGLFSQWGETSEGQPNYRILPRKPEDIEKLKIQLVTPQIKGLETYQSINYQIPLNFTHDAKSNLNIEKENQNEEIVEPFEAETKTYSSHSILYTSIFSSGVGMFLNLKKFKDLPGLLAQLLDQ